MPKAVTLILTFAFSIFALFACSKEKISPEEENLLKSLNHMHLSMDRDGSYEKFKTMLIDAKIKINRLQQNSKRNLCFMDAVEKCYASYEIVGKAWKGKMETKDEKKRADMDMALSFSLSFAALNIEKAQKCYND